METVKTLEQKRKIFFRVAALVSIFSSILYVPRLIWSLFPLEQFSQQDIILSDFFNSLLVLFFLPYTYFTFTSMLKRKYNIHGLNKYVVFVVLALIFEVYYGSLFIDAQPPIYLEQFRSMIYPILLGLVFSLFGIRVLLCESELYGLKKPLSFTLIGAGIVCITLIFYPLLFPLMLILSNILIGIVLYKATCANDDEVYDTKAKDQMKGNHKKLFVDVVNKHKKLFTIVIAVLVLFYIVFVTGSSKIKPQSILSLDSQNPESHRVDASLKKTLPDYDLSYSVPADNYLEIELSSDKEIPSIQEYKDATRIVCSVLLSQKKEYTVSIRFIRVYNILGGFIHFPREQGFNMVSACSNL